MNRPGQRQLEWVPSDAEVARRIEGWIAITRQRIQNTLEDEDLIQDGDRFAALHLARAEGASQEEPYVESITPSPNIKLTTVFWPASLIGWRDLGVGMQVSEPGVGYRSTIYDSQDFNQRLTYTHSSILGRQIGTSPVRKKKQDASAGEPSKKRKKSSFGKVYTGPRGGRYIIKKGKKKYI